MYLLNFVAVCFHALWLGYSKLQSKFIMPKGFQSIKRRQLTNDPFSNSISTQ